jgi:heme exporter protein D
MTLAALITYIARLLLNVVIWLRDRSRVLDGEARERARSLQEAHMRAGKARAARRRVRIDSAGMRGGDLKDKYRRD